MNRCSFCGKKQGDVRLIAGPGVFICHLCVALCNEILAHEMPGGRPNPELSPERAQPPSAGPKPVIRAQVSSSTRVARPEIPNT